MNVNGVARKSIIGLIALLISIALLLTINSLIVKFQKKEQLLLTEKMLHHSELISAQQRAAIDNVLKMNIKNCDEADINKLRGIVWDYQDVVDLGILKNGKVICTAGWGKIEEDKGYFNSEYTTIFGYSFIRYTKNFFGKKINVDATAYKDVIAFTSPYAFEQIKSIFQKIFFTVSTKDKKHIFISGGDNIPFDDNQNDHSGIKIEVCSQIYDICITTYSAYCGILSLSFFWESFIFLLCALTGVMFSYSLGFYLKLLNNFDYRLKKAIYKEQLYLEFQPVVRVRDEKVIGAEALLRWNDGYYGKVSPELFISVSERIGLYSKISKFVIKSLMNELSDFLIKNIFFTVSINIGSYEIKETHFLDFLYEQVSRHDVKPSQIKIEITERITEPYQVIAEFSRKARAKGFIVSLDDFGTGVANLIWLTEIDFDEIKIDKFYVKGLHEEYKRNILTSILNLVEGLGVQTVFEGVEDRIEFDFVKAYDMNSYIQGWLFYKSMTKLELYKLLDFKE